MFSMNDLRFFPSVPNRGRVPNWYPVIQEALRVDESQQLPHDTIIAHEHSRNFSYMHNDVNTEKFSYVALWQQNIENLIFGQILKSTGSFADIIHCTY